MKLVYIEFNHAPHIIAVNDNGNVSRYTKVNIKGPSCIVSVEERTAGNPKQAWIEVEDSIEIQGVDEKMSEKHPIAISDFYRQGADAYFKKHLAHLIGLPNLRFLEVGSYAGSSAVGVIEDILTDSTSTVTCVDVWYSPFAEAKFDKVTAPYENQVIKYSSFSEPWLKSHEEDRYDFIYIDGDHSAEAVKIDITLAWPLLKSNGIMALDDYLYQHQRGVEHNPKSVIDAFLLEIAEEVEILEISEQVWIKKK
jgi:predicted O-methyltransferase YrrM